MSGLFVWEEGKIWSEVECDFTYVRTMAVGGEGCSCERQGALRARLSGNGNFARVLCAVHGGAQYKFRVGRTSVLSGVGLHALESIPAYNFFGEGMACNG